MSPCGSSVNLEDLFLEAPVVFGQPDCWADKMTICFSAIMQFEIFYGKSDSDHYRSRGIYTT